jgi:peptidoglycan/xylan/chitin deacetylase (PgdA/CDA1 family)
VTGPRDPVYERRRAEREARRQAIGRRRRVLAIAAAVVALAVVVVVVALVAGGSEDGQERPASSPGAAREERREVGGAPARPEARPETRVSPSRRDRPVPILMYHAVNEPPPGAGLPELYVAKDDFEAQMRWLKARGYSAVTMQQVYDLWKKGVALPRRPVVVSFDDGYRSVWTNALPIMKRRGLPGVLNLELSQLTKTDEGGIAEEQVRDLMAAGWEIDSHTVSHPDLTSLDDAGLRRELVGSRRRIRRKFGRPASFFCYPAGRYDPRIVAAVKAAGYLAATTTNFGNAGPNQLFTLNRVRIDRSDGVDGFIRKMRALRGAGVAPAPPSFGGIPGE